MSIVSPEKLRSSISDFGGQLQIVIPTKKNWFIILFFAAWLVGWAVGEFTVPTAFFNKGNDTAPLIFTAAWLVAWTVGGMFIIYTWLWQAFGKEIITVDGSYISIKKNVFGLGKLNQYQIGHIKNLRIAPMGYNPWDFRSRMQFSGLTGGVLAFDYGARTFWFGIGVDEVEANEILKKISYRLPNVVSKGPKP